MNIQNFYITLILLISFSVFISAVSAIFSKNLIFSVFSLIFYFFSGIWFFVFYRAEYVMVLFLIIYLGAIVVFFLFVLMLLDKKYWEMREQPSITSKKSKNFYSFNFLLYLILFVIAVCVLFFCFFIGFQNFNLGNNITLYFTTNNDDTTTFVLSNAERIGIALYSEFGILLIIGGLILLLAIVGCVLIIKPFRSHK